MPYQIVRVARGLYSVVNMETGKIHSYGTTKKKAERQYRFLNGIDHEFIPSKYRKK